MNLGTKILSFTGHRPKVLGGYGDDVFAKLCSLAARVILEEKPDSCVSGFALGWDQAVAFTCLELGIPLTAAVPYEGQERMWPRESQRFYHQLIARCSDVHFVCDEGYAGWKMNRRNEWMVDNSTKLIALYNGSLTGGTANCVLYAERVGAEMRNVWPTWEEMNHGF